MELPTKAKHGDPCTRCARCCANEVCGVMLAMTPDATPPCPGLGYNRDHNLFSCRIVQSEQQFIEPQDNWLITQALGIGKGCDSDDW